MDNPPAYLWVLIIAGVAAVSRRPGRFRRYAARRRGPGPGIPRPLKVPAQKGKPS